MNQDAKDYAREEQAKVLYEKGWGEQLGITPFAEYLKTIPEIPLWPLEWAARFDQTILVDARLGVSQICSKLGVLNADTSDDQIFDFDSSKAMTDPVYWINCHDGQHNRCKTFVEYQNNWGADEVGLNVYEGLCFFAQNRLVLSRHYLDFPGSTYLFESGKEEIGERVTKMFAKGSLLVEQFQGDFESCINLLMQNGFSRAEALRNLAEVTRNGDMACISLHLYLGQPSLFVHPDAALPKFGAPIRGVYSKK